MRLAATKREGELGAEGRRREQPSLSNGNDRCTREAATLESITSAAATTPPPPPPSPLTPTLRSAMASKHAIVRPLGSVLRAARASNVSRSALRTFATSSVRAKELAGDVSDLPNLRHAQRGPQGKLEHAPVINHADRTQDRASEQHRYGQYLLSCLPKYIQQYALRRLVSMAIL